MSTSSKMSTRLTMPGQIHKAYKVMLKLIHPKYIKTDQKIPRRILKNAKGIAFITVIKAGFMWSGTVGSGIVVARLSDGTWSGPSSIGVAGMGWGALIGASVTDSVIILNTDLAVKAFSGHGQVKFGGNLSVAAGPVGREGDGSAYVGDGGVAACYSYSHSRGLFAGISLQGAVMMTRDSDNAKFYGCPVKSWDILKGKVLPPEFEDLKNLYEILAVVNSSETDNFSFRDPKMKSFRDSSGVSFHATPGAAYQSHKFDDDADDDDDVPRASVVSGSGGGFAWGEDADDDALAKAIMATTVAEKSDDLQPGWVRVTTEGGQPYYWHEESGKTQWEAPLKPQAVAKAVPVPAPPPAKEDPDTLPPGWVKVVTGDGKPYYWNEDKNVTQWERPQSVKLPAASQTPVVPPRRSSSTTNAAGATAQTSSRTLTQPQTAAAGFAAAAAAQANSKAGNVSSVGMTPQQQSLAFSTAAAARQTITPQQAAAAQNYASNRPVSGNAITMTPQQQSLAFSTAVAARQTVTPQQAAAASSAAQSYASSRPAAPSQPSFSSSSAARPAVPAARPSVPARPASMTSKPPAAQGNPFDSM